ncbi:MAG TPA: hypothetical protein VNQ90_20505 [Chthoniobacteraceae bacterium]|nr:hypothetical protein [Chthoniobacteraceae bacterium]
MKTARLSCFSTFAGVFGLLCALLFGALLPVAAQEATEEEMTPPAEIDLQAVQTEEPVVPATYDPAMDEPLPLLPDLPATDANFFDTAPTGVSTADRLRAAIRIRELKTISQREPEIVAQRDLARDAKTYEGRRTALRNYYTLLSRSIIKKDATIKEPVEAELSRKLKDLEQDKVRPSVLIEAIEPVPGSRPERPTRVVVEEVVKPVKKKGAE